MRLVELYNKIKLLNTDKIVLIKFGSFYRTYGYDAIILCKIFGYNINNNMVGFPVFNCGRNVNVLNNLGMGVILINGDDIVNYEIVSNNYDKYLDDAIKCDLVNKKIENINIKVSQKIRDDINNYYKIDEFLNSI